MVFSSLEQTIRDKSAVVGVIGLGYVGLPPDSGLRRRPASGPWGSTSIRARSIGFWPVRAISRIFRRAGLPSVSRRRLPADRRHAAAGRSRRPVDLRPHAAEREPRSRT